MIRPFLRTYPPAMPTPGPAYWFPFRGDRLLLKANAHEVQLIQGDKELEELLHAESALYFGMLDGKPCRVCEVNQEFVLPPGWQEFSLRGLFGRIDEQTSAIVGYALQLLQWQQISRYCPRCGHSREMIAGTWGKRCPNCGYISYPPVTPAILVLIYQSDRLLLTHKPGWGKRYSCIAGFVEPGESLEECVQREVYEEVGLEVTDISYVGSQAWPFPHQLMVGYTARYLKGTLHLDEQELDDAIWFHPDTLPELPPPQSLARQIIITWLASHTTQGTA